MTIALIIALSCLSSLASLFIWAAVGDARRFTIPNRISAAILLIYPVFVISASLASPLYPNINWLGALLTAAIVLIIGAALFAKGFMGGGDVKLLASASLWAAPHLIFDMLALTALSGGVLALGAMARRALVPAGRGENAGDGEQALPYGVAIAVGGLYVAGRLAFDLIKG